MARLASLLLMFALVVTNGSAFANTICQHADAAAHHAALRGDDAGKASRAAAEEAAAAVSTKKGSSVEPSPVQLAGFIAPNVPTLPAPTESAATATRAADENGPPGRAPRPLLPPPLA